MVSLPVEALWQTLRNLNDFVLSRSDFTCKSR
jgi:hypothetical protein